MFNRVRKKPRSREIFLECIARLNLHHKPAVVCLALPKTRNHIGNATHIGHADQDDEVGVANHIRQRQCDISIEQYRNTSQTERLVEPQRVVAIPADTKRKIRFQQILGVLSARLRGIDADRRGMCGVTVTDEKIRVNAIAPRKSSENTTTQIQPFDEGASSGGKCEKCKRLVGQSLYKRSDRILGILVLRPSAETDSRWYIRLIADKEALAFQILGVRRHDALVSEQLRPVLRRTKDNGILKCDRTRAVTVPENYNFLSVAERCFLALPKVLRVVLHRRIVVRQQVHIGTGRIRHDLDKRLPKIAKRLFLEQLARRQILRNIRQEERNERDARKPLDVHALHCGQYRLVECQNLAHAGVCFCERMARSYDQMLGYVFRRNSLRFALRTFLPTLRYFLTRPALPPPDGSFAINTSTTMKQSRETPGLAGPSAGAQPLREGWDRGKDTAGGPPALCTMNILPPMMTVWYHFARKSIGKGADIVIFDCTGTLDPKEFPDARVLPFLNFYAATKGNIFIRSIARNRRIAWICDDDMFLMSRECLPILEREFAVSNTASVSFRPREWWEFDFDGKRIQPSSSYCTAMNREIFMKEKLSLAPAPDNPHPAINTRPPRRYDTFDRANEILLQKGYRCAIVPPEERERCVAEFSGLSGAVMLLHHFRSSEQTLDYFRSAPPERWSGNLLFGLMSAMLSVCTIQELYTKLRGKPYPLPSLPPRGDLLNIIEERKTFIRPDQTLEAVNKTTARLHTAL